MRIQKGILTSVLVAVSWLSTGCSAPPARITAPSPLVADAAASGLSREAPTPPARPLPPADGSPLPLPPPPGTWPLPPVERGPVPPAPPRPPAIGTCNAALVTFTVGETASVDLLERARVAAGAASARFLHPNQPITMELAEWRLNLGVDGQEVVRSAYCG